MQRMEQVEVKLLRGEIKQSYLKITSLFLIQLGIGKK